MLPVIGFKVETKSSNFRWWPHAAPVDQQEPGPGRELVDASRPERSTRPRLTVETKECFELITYLETH